MKLLLQFDRNAEYIAPQGRILCAIVTIFAQFVSHFRMRQLLKFRWISLGVTELGGFKLTGSGFPQISALCVRTSNF